MLALVLLTLAGQSPTTPTATPTATTTTTTNAAPVAAAAATSVALAPQAADRAELARAFARAVGRDQITSTQLSGELGEAITDRRLTRDLRLSGNWQPVTSRIGPQGLDHLNVRLDSRGRVRDLMVTETKTGSSTLKMTADGRQMSDPWLRRRLRTEGERFAAAARQTTVAVKPVPPSAQRLQVPAADGKALVFHRPNKTSPWAFAGPANRLQEARQQASRIATATRAAAEGRLPYRRRLVEYQFDGERLTLTHRDASTVAGPGRRLPVLRQQTIRLSPKELQANLQTGRAAVTNTLLSKNPQLTRATAKTIARDMVADVDDLQQLIDGRSGVGRPARANRMPLSLKVGAALAVASFLAEHGERLLEGRLPPTKALAQSAVVFGAATAGGYAVEKGVEGIADRVVGSQLAKSVRPGMLAPRTPVGKMFAARTLARGAGGVAVAVLYAYAGYLLGQYDLTTANRSAAAGLVAASVTAFVLPSLLLAIAPYIGTAATGVAIGGLSGAAATSASMAWASSAALGGPGLVLGAVIVIGVSSAVSYSFAAWDAKLDNKRIRLTIDRLEQAYASP